MYNSKKLTSVVACSFLLSGSLVNADFFTKENRDRLTMLVQGVTILGGGTIGIKMQTMNDEYTAQGKKTDANMRLKKTLGAMSLVLTIEYINSNKSLDSWSNAMEMAIKIGAFGASTAMLTDPVAKFFRDTPGINSISGFLTDPVDSDGKEMKDCGAATRCLITYLTIRPLAIKVAKKFFSK